jgi:Immunoglobulin-like domain of bacterial spore germination
VRAAGVLKVLGLAAVLGLSACVPPKGADGKAAVIIDQPKAGTKVTSPLHITGTADVFEATFRLQLVDVTGTTVLSDQMVMATCGTGCRGTFDVIMGFPAWTGPVKLKAYEYSPKDGHRIELAAVALTG